MTAKYKIDRKISTRTHRPTQLVAKQPFSPPVDATLADPILRTATQPELGRARPEYGHDSLLSPQQAAEFLGIAVHTLANWRAGENTGPIFTKVGRVRYRYADLLAFIECKLRRNTSEIIPESPATYVPFQEGLVDGARLGAKRKR